MREIKIIGKPKQNSEKEVLNYIGCLDLITEKLLKSLEDVHTENEQYFGECSILGTDRLSLKESVKDLLEINMKALLRRVETNQEIKIVFGDKEVITMNEFDQIGCGKFHWKPFGWCGITRIAFTNPSIIIVCNKCKLREVNERGTNND